MALKDAGRCYRSVASSGFTVTPPSNESWIVRNLFSVPSSNDTYLTATVGGRTVGKYRIKGKSGNHMPYPVVKTTQLYEVCAGTLFDLANQLGKPLDIPIANGESFNVARYAEAGNVTMIYDAYDRDDVLATAINGSHCTTSRYPHYLDNSAAITTTPAILDSSLMWAGGEYWPFISGTAGAGVGREVPAGINIEILAILASPYAAGNGGGANEGYTTYLELVKGGVTLWDPLSSVGLACVGDVSVTTTAGTYTPISSVVGSATATQPYPPFIPPQPCIFTPQDTLVVQFAIAAAAANGILASTLDCALLLERRPA